MTVGYVDGVFDLFHCGHANFLRQALAALPPLSSLLVGVNSSSSVALAKGVAPVYSDEERGTILRAIRFVSELLPEAPYTLSSSLLRTLIDEKGVGVVMHGEDMATDEEGRDCYQVAKDWGCFRTLRRTEGVSTTDIIAKLITWDDERLGGAKLGGMSRAGPVTMMLPARRIAAFVGARSARRVEDATQELEADDERNRIVYIQGSFDLITPYHVKVLEDAREMGSKLIVGILRDEAVQRRSGLHRPLLGLNERAIALLSLRCVYDVILGVDDTEITDSMRNAVGIDVDVKLNAEDEDRALEEIAHRVGDRRKEYVSRTEKKLAIAKKTESFTIDEIL